MTFLRKTLVLALFSVSILLLSTVVFAENLINVQIDNKALNMDVPPVIINDRTLVPLRAIFEALGAVVEWDDSTSTVTAKKDGSTIILKIDDEHPTVNGKQQQLDVAATVIDDRTMVPVRFIATSLGTYVQWDEKTNTVFIITPKVISFNDANLEKIVRDKVKIPTGALKNSDVWGIDMLDASNAKIESIKGIENFYSLINLNLSKNIISDIGPLKSFEKLKTLDLSSNRIKDISVLTNMQDLDKIHLEFNPLESLTAITKFSSKTDIYLLDNKNAIKKTNKNSMGEYEKVIKKAAEITDSIITSDMTDLQKEFAIHDYLALHSKYDIESYVNLISSDFCHSAYGALIEGKAVCDGYAKAAEIMLNMVGIECTTVTGISYSYTGRPIGHAWNIVKIDGNYYHLDVSGDDSDGDNNVELDHFFFNLSDKQISLTRSWDVNNYPKCVTDGKEYDVYTKLVRTTIYTKDAIFKVATSNLYKIDPKTSNATKLIDDKVLEIQMLDDWIYYINESDNRCLYKIKTDGTNRTKVREEPCVHIIVKDNLIFYISSESKQLYELDVASDSPVIVNTGDVTTYIFEIDGWIYFRTYSWYKGGSIKRIRNSNGASEDIVKQTPQGFTEGNSDDRRMVSYSFGPYERISGGYLYYIKAEDKTLYRVKLDGTDGKQITDNSIDGVYFEVIGEYIYYKNTNDGNKTYRVNIDGSQNICIQ